MSRQSTDEQLRFLLSCVRHSQNGKVRHFKPRIIIFESLTHARWTLSKWQKSVGSSPRVLRRSILEPVQPQSQASLLTDYLIRAKRFERMMKANDINPNGGPAAAPPLSTLATPTKKPKKDTKSINSKGSAAKKRKIDDNSRRASADDDDGAALKPEGLQQEGSPAAPEASKPPRRASRTSSVFENLTLNLNNEEKTKNAGPGSGNGHIFGGLYDGAEGTIAVVYADPNWGAAFPNHDNTHSAASSTENPFDAFIHSDHPLHAPSSEFEAALSLNTESKTAVEELQYGNGQVKLKTESIFIED